MSSASGLALSIRKAEESETFDLGGQNVTTISNTIQSAFAEPLALKEMIRITFVTGAGKQARQKYDEGAARAVTSTLRELGYDEDRAASCVMECAGTFKMQHDTAKNLKTIVVFPKIQVPGGGEGDTETGATKQSLIPEGCPAHQIAMSSVNVFERMLRSKCPSWSQKKGCQAALEHIKHMVDELDGKLMQGTPLDSAEQDFYDNVTGLDDKLSHVKEELHKQVESGVVTKFEKETLLHQNAERLAMLAQEMEDAKGQKLEKLKAMKTKATQRKELLQDIDPKPPHKLRHEIEIARLWKEAVPLLQMEEKTKGRLLAVKETQAMARKDEIMEEIESLEEASRGWFEDDAAFDARVKAIRAAFTAKLHQKPKAKKAAGSYAAALTSGATTAVRQDKWVIPGQDNKKNAWGSAATGKEKKTAKGSGVFAAMMAKSDDSDSDMANEEDEEEVANDSEDEEEETAVAASPKKASSPAKQATVDTSIGNNNNPQHNDDAKPGKKKNKKKNKKSKGGKKKKDEADMSDDELLATTAAANAAAQRAKEEEQEVSHPAIAFLKNYLIPFILGFIAFIVSLFFGKPKQKQKKR